MSRAKRAFGAIVTLAVVLAAALPAAAGDKAINVQVYDDTARRPVPEKAELWYRGTGSVWLKRELAGGGALVVLKPRPVGDGKLVLYPDGRGGRELVVPLRLTDELCAAGCARDAILLTISDEQIELVGAPLVGGTKKFRR